MISIIPSSIFNEPDKCAKVNKNKTNSHLQSHSPFIRHDSNRQSKKSILDQIYLDIRALKNCCAVENNGTTLSYQENEASVSYKHNGSTSIRFEHYASGFKNRMEPTFKCLVIGDIGVGKTSFVQRYVYQRKIRDYKGTLGVDFALKIVKWSDNINIKLQMWDIAGQERFQSMTRVYYKDAHVCIIMFDLTNRNTFLNALKWKRDLDLKCTLPDGSPVPCILLGNKCDMPNRNVDQEELEKFSADHGFIGHGEISVKDGRMVEESMRFLLGEIMRRYSDASDLLDLSTEEHSSNLRLDGTKQENIDKNCNC